MSRSDSVNSSDAQIAARGPQPWPIVGRWDYIGVPLVVLAFVIYLLVTR